MIGKLLDSVFGCWHSHYSFPITVRPGLRRNRSTAQTGTYVVCLDCGKELPYDWQEMKVMSTADQQHRVGTLATKEAA